MKIICFHLYNNEIRYIGRTLADRFNALGSHKSEFILRKQRFYWKQEAALCALGYINSCVLCVAFSVAVCTLRCAFDAVHIMICFNFLAAFRSIQEYSISCEIYFRFIAWLGTSSCIQFSNGDDILYSISNCLHGPVRFMLHERMLLAFINPVE